MKPHISVCIPTYNGSRYLRKCLDSVIAQTFTDFEVLIVDDRSSDKTVNIAKEYAAKDRRIQVIVNERNLGLVGNWNRCVELARGEWIKFVFQDDLIEPTCLERLLAASKPEIPIIFCRRQFIFAEDTPPFNRSYHQSALALLDRLFAEVTEFSASQYTRAVIEQIAAKGVHINFVGEPIAVMLHRSVFNRFGNFNAYLIHSCDFEFWTRVASNTGIIYVPETLATFRVHGESTSAANQGSRYYHKTRLDPLAILHDFAFNPIYASFRAAYSHPKSISLTNLVAAKAYDTRRIAERAMNDTANPNPDLLVEWQKFMQLYPILEIISQRTLLKRIIIHSLYRWKQLQRQAQALFKATV